MKARLCALVLSLMFIYNSKAQNLITNGDFESYWACPGTSGFGISQASPWTTATARSPLYFNVCATIPDFGVPVNADSSLGYQWPRSGNGYGGFDLYLLNNSFVRAYAQVALNDTLKAGRSYCLTFYVNLWNGSYYGIDAIGANFCDTPVTCTTFNCLINAVPQVSNSTGNIILDTLGWTKIEGCYTANGGEKYLTIGNFKTDSQTQTALSRPGYNWSSFYYLDDVSLYEDTTLSVNEVQEESYLTLSPNPASNIITLSYNASDSPTTFMISDVTGKIIIESELKNYETFIDISQLKNGLYFFNCKLESGRMLCKKFVVANK